MIKDYYQTSNTDGSVGVEFTEYYRAYYIQNPQNNGSW